MVLAFSQGNTSLKVLRKSGIFACCFSVPKKTRFPWLWFLVVEGCWYQGIQRSLPGCGLKVLGELDLALMKKL